MMEMVGVASFLCYCIIPPSVQRINLSEALTGFNKVITTLDKRQLVIRQLPGDIIKHGQWVWSMMVGVVNVASQ